MVDSPNQDAIDQSTDNIAAVILAAGKASRMGESKLLLPWHGQPLLWHVIKKALSSKLQKIFVVTGAHNLSSVLDQFSEKITIVHNPDWQAGQSTSVIAGINALSPIIEGAMFLLGDQPFIEPILINRLMDKFQNSRCQVIAPMVNGHRCNPILFAQSTFKDFKKLKGDSGARQIIALYQIETLEWNDPNLNFDIDSPQDYQRLLSL